MVCWGDRQHVEQAGGHLAQGDRIRPGTHGPSTAAPGAPGLRRRRRASGRRPGVHALEESRRDILRRARRGKAAPPRPSDDLGAEFACELPHLLVVPISLQRIGDLAGLGHDRVVDRFSLRRYVPTLGVGLLGDLAGLGRQGRISATRSRRRSSRNDVIARPLSESAAAQHKPGGIRRSRRTRRLPRPGRTRVPPAHFQGR